MAKKKEENTSITFLLKQYAFQIMAVLVTIANIWLANQLAPLRESLTTIVGRVNALEENSKDDITRTEFDARMADMRDRLVRIEGKLDR